MSDLNNTIKERNEALFSLDERKIRAYAKRNQITLPKNQKTFWAGVHKARCEMTLDVIPKDEQIKSAAWLMERGMFPGIGNGPNWKMKCSKVKP